jgi:hypothetical protein
LKSGLRACRLFFIATWMCFGIVPDKESIE